MFSKAADSGLRFFKLLLLFFVVFYWTFAVYRTFSSAFTIPSTNYPFINYVFPAVYQFFKDTEKESPNVLLVFTTQSGEKKTVDVRDFFVDKTKNRKLWDGNRYYLDHNQFFYPVYFINSEFSKNQTKSFVTDKDISVNLQSIVLESEKILNDLGYSFSELRHLEIDFFTTKPLFVDGKYQKHNKSKKIVGVGLVDLDNKTMRILR